jgi:hypothetical protein
VTDVKFDLQEYLRDMEGRVVNKIDEVHEDVKDHSIRIVTLEQDAAKIKWLWRVVTALLLAGISQVSFAFFGG